MQKRDPVFPDRVSFFTAHLYHTTISSSSVHREAAVIRSRTTRDERIARR